jgi:hypothetical protein
MNWVESSVLVLLGIFALMYLGLIFLTSPRRARGAHRHKFRPFRPRNGYEPLRPHGLHDASDSEVSEFVRNRLHLRSGLSGVEVRVQDGVVTLSGRVLSAEDRELAENIAGSVPHVRSVANETRVRSVA